MNWPASSNFKILQSTLVKNSAWGVMSNVFQTVFVSLFFVIVARKYHPDQFAEFLISVSVYQLVAAFASMGLGQWFIRQYVVETDRLTLSNKFLKTQLGLGLVFYLVNIALAYLIYPDGQIRLLCIILGTNIIFDNAINALRSLNIAEFRQNKTAAILMIDGFLKLLVGCLLFINPFSSVILSMMLIGVRILTLSLFIKLGSSDTISLNVLWRANISVADLKILVIKNWQFMVIGSVSIIYWKIANIIISKYLPLSSVADYEISCRVFTILGILPVVAAATIYPQFIKYFNEKDFAGLTRFYKNIFLVYTLFAILSYAFIYSFSDLIIPLAFGNGYPGAILCLKQMFLTFLLLPTVLLQANLIVAIGLERLDMLFNLISLVINVAGCIIGLYYFQSLSVINYSIFFSFLIFHLSQDMILVRRKLTSIKSCLLYYTTLAVFIGFYHYMTLQLNPYIFFVFFSGVVICAFLAVILMQKKKLYPIAHLGSALPGK